MQEIDNDKMEKLVLTEDMFEPLDMDTVDEEFTQQTKSIWWKIAHHLKENKLALICFVILLIIILASLLAPLSPYDPDKIDVINKLQPADKEHWFGTDEMGRDQFTRALYGGRVSLLVAFSSMVISVAVGTLIGTISGYIGGKLDMIIMRCIDIIMSIPSFLLIVVLNAFISPSLSTLVLLISLFGWMSVARIIRAETLSLKERDFILASHGLGSSGIRIIFNHLIPNTMSSLIVAASLAVAKAILTESALSFLNFGVQLPLASWGSMLKNAQDYILDQPMLAIYPGMLILLTVLSFNILGDTLRSALEPRQTK